MTPFEAALKGSREIGFAVVAMTLTLAAVYAPIAFQTGRTGKLFTEFALTLAGAVLVSGFVALTLSPMMCVEAAAPQRASHGLLYRADRARARRADHGYRRALRFTLDGARWPWCVVLVWSPARPASCSRRCRPSCRRSRTAASSSASASRPRARPSTSPTATRSGWRIFYGQVPEVEQYFMVVGFPVVNQAISFIRLKDWEERDAQAAAGRRRAGAEAVRRHPRHPRLPDQAALARPEPDREAGPVRAADLGALRGAAEGGRPAARPSARKNPRLVNLDTDLKLNKPELRVDVDRDKVADLGVDVDDGRPHARDDARRPPGHALQARTASSTT